MVSSAVTDNTADFGGALMVQLNAQLTCTGSTSEVAGIYDNGNTEHLGGVVYLYDTAQLIGNSCVWLWLYRQQSRRYLFLCGRQY